MRKKHVDVTLAMCDAYSVNCRVKRSGRERNRLAQCPHIQDGL